MIIRYPRKWVRAQHIFGGRLKFPKTASQRNDSKKLQQ